MTTRDVLIKARALYASAPSHAAKGTWPDLGTYCVATAVDNAHDARAKRGAAAYRAFKATIGGVSPIDYNATHSTAEVLAVFDQAIQEAS